MTHATLNKGTLQFNPGELSYRCEGEWSILTAPSIISQLKHLSIPANETITIQGKNITRLDSAGALALLLWVEKLKKKKNSVHFSDFTTQHQDFLHLIESKQADLRHKPPVPQKKGFLYAIGQESLDKLKQMDGLLLLIGDLSTKLAAAFKDWRHFQFPGIVANMYSTGVTALPIVALLSLLIGVVLAYQMGLQLESYGANIFIAYLSGMAIFREFAPLITAIIVAGRTSSAFTAQIGSMKIHEEIDALRTMGLSPTELLVVPKVIGLLLVFPLLIFWSALFGILGAMIMSKFMLNIGYAAFLSRLQESVGFKQLLLGLYKAPAFALLIALVGCFQGFRVQANADSIGGQTTKSVVQALFLIIIADAIYSVLYSWLGL